MARNLTKSAAREGKVLLIVLAMVVAYMAGSADTNCWVSVFHDLRAVQK